MTSEEQAEPTDEEVMAYLARPVRYTQVGNQVFKAPLTDEDWRMLRSRRVGELVKERYEQRGHSGVTDSEGIRDGREGDR